MNESLFERLRFWFCHKVLHHKFTNSWVYNDKCHNSCKICRRTVSFEVNEKFSKCASKFDWRCRFTFFPVSRYILDSAGYVNKSGTYWLQYVYEVNVGVVPSWIAYASNNDKEENE